MLQMIEKCYSKYGPQSVNQALPGSLLDVQILSPHHRSTESESLQRFWGRALKSVFS